MVQPVCEFVQQEPPLVMMRQLLFQGRWGFWGDFEHMTGKQHWGIIVTCRVLLLETFSPWWPRSFIFLDSVIQNSRFPLYSDLHMAFHFHFCFQPLLWLWSKLFNVILLFPLSLSAHHILSGPIHSKGYFILILTVGLGSDNESFYIKYDLLLCSCTKELVSSVKELQKNVSYEGPWEVIWSSSLPRAGHLMATRFCQY